MLVIDFISDFTYKRWIIQREIQMDY
jgi:hypothetical protein